MPIAFRSAANAMVPQSTPWRGKETDRQTDRQIDRQTDRQRVR